MDRATLLKATIGVESLAGVIALVAIRLASVQPAWASGPAQIGGGVALGLLTAAGAIGLTRIRPRILARLQADFQLAVRLFGKATVLDLAVVSLLAGVGEELLFRGFLQTWFAQAAGAHVAVLAAAVVFGLAHAISRSYVVFASVLGISLGYLYHLTGSLPAAMVAHAVYDFAALYYGTRIMQPADETSGASVH